VDVTTCRISSSCATAWPAGALTIAEFGIARPIAPISCPYSGTVKSVKWSPRRLADGAPLALKRLSLDVRDPSRAAGLTRIREEVTRCFVRLRRDDIDSRYPELLDAVLAAAGHEDIGGDVGLTVPAGSDSP
jgi:hypothetical protein